MTDANGLTVDGVGVRFGGLVALDDVSVEVPPGTVVGVIGPNGAGKTTLFNVVCGFVRPTTGSMRWDGRPFAPRPDRLAAAGIARTLQGLGLFAGLTVLENVMVGAHRRSRAGFTSALFGLPPSDRDERRLREAALATLDSLEIAALAGAHPGALPYAVQKKVALARALVSQPRLLLLDEPAGGLGAEEVEELADLIRTLPKRSEQPCAVMLVEHHMDLVMSVCDRIFVLDFGKRIAVGSPAEVQDDPAVTEAYLGAEAVAS
ncbi:ABC transporter ATP-binding protein [Cryptosporangium aurantiacum]|uniref:Amino acid/amide ABC transporter ATP-binding protein 1, HAAT family n=1 Tax=Cryptosporangium aurantiacum TaxID=134849 RepID=A0A1M7JKL0_9ACTN|nr:ABC transporter ATP-binding protein [Cryptosporangium aurantiacum]SHM53534.1 amino acid/amide ABC transporter ATP-binding protein 1, HAAT family [Cryptosporangium aurantiacum]